MAIKIDRDYMVENLRSFMDEEMEDMDHPDIFIIIVARGDDLVFSTSSNSRKMTSKTLKKAVWLDAMPDTGAE